MFSASSSSSSTSAAIWPFPQVSAFHLAAEQQHVELDAMWRFGFSAESHGGLSPASVFEALVGAARGLKKDKSKGPPTGGPSETPGGGYFFLPAGAEVVARPAVASTFGFSFLGFLVSLLDFI